MLKTKENRIILLITIIVACLIYSSFLTGYFSMDTEKIVEFGYDGYAMNYSFYDGRIIMGIICLVANLININLKLLYIILVAIAILISSITVLKLCDIINKYKDTGIKQKIILAIIAFCYIFNFMTINNMEFIECMVMALSVLLYILATENIVIKKDSKKAFLYTFFAGICYQGTINILFITTILFMLLGYKKEEKTSDKKIIFCVMWAVIAIIGDAILKILMDVVIGNTVQPDRMNMNILENIKNIFQGMNDLIIESLLLFPKYAYLIFNVGSLIIICIYCIKNKKVLTWYNAVLLFVISIASSLVLLVVYDGIAIANGRIFGSIGASFSVIWLYAYVKTDIFTNKGIIKNISILIVVGFFILNCYNIFQTTTMFREVNEKDQEIAKSIEQKITQYEAQTGNKIKYVKIRYNPISKNMYGNLDFKLYLRSMVMTARFNENIIKLYTGIDLEKEYFDESEIEKLNGESIVCIEDTVYMLVK